MRKQRRSRADFMTVAMRALTAVVVILFAALAVYGMVARLGKSDAQQAETAGAESGAAEERSAQTPAEAGMPGGETPEGQGPEGRTPEEGMPGVEASDRERNGEGASEEEETVYTYTELTGVMYSQTSLNVRAEPSVDGSRIGGLYRNQEVEVTGRCNETGWYRIDYGGEIGYVSNDYLAEEPVEIESAGSVGDFAEVDRSYFDDVLFIGDSLTVGLRSYGGLSGAEYFCISGIGADEARTLAMDDGRTLEAVLDAGQYRAVYLLLGINDMGLTRRAYLSVYDSLLDYIREQQPDARIVIQSVLMVTATYSGEHAGFDNDEIRARNTALAERADGEQVFYLDLNAYFMDSMGFLDPALSGDGLHLTSRAYRMWGNVLLKNGVGE